MTLCAIDWLLSLQLWAFGGLMKVYIPFCALCPVGSFAGSLRSRLPLNAR